MSKPQLTKIKDLTPDARNANKGTERGRGMLEDSLRKYGAGRSILIDKNGKIIAGNKTIETAGSIGLENIIVVPTDGKQIVAVQRMDLDLETDKAAKELAIADNRVAQVDLDFDIDVLAGLQGEIDLTQFWHPEELAALLGTVTEIEPGAGGDEFDATPQAGETRCKAGDLWALGEHRLLCGDSTDPANIQRLCGTEAIDILWTDPPYNVDYEGKTDEALKIENDLMPSEDFRAFLGKAFFAADCVMKPGAVYYIAHPDIFAYEFIGAVRDVDWKQARPPVVLWIKDSFVFGRGDYHSKSEPILYGWKPGASHHAVSDRTQDNVWDCPRPNASTDHPTMKPVELIERALKNSSKEGDKVLDLFGGSGSTLIASVRQKRKAFLCELSAQYCDVILRRYEAETGQTATRIE